MPKVQILCANCNHYYDGSLSECPYCNSSIEIGNGNEKICPNCGRSYDSSSGGCPYCDEIPPTEPKYKEITCPRCGKNHDAALFECPYCGYDYDAIEKETTCPNCGKNHDAALSECPYCGYDDKTKPPVDDEKMTLVVGWLVCIAGADKGRDFRLHVDNNSVGRGVENDINLKDTKVSRQRHFSVVYDSENDNYFVMMGGGTGIVRVNNLPLGGNTSLKMGDKIRVGDTTLVFIPLETAYVQWKWE